MVLLSFTCDKKYWRLFEKLTAQSVPNQLQSDFNPIMEKLDMDAKQWSQGIHFNFVAIVMI